MGRTQRKSLSQTNFAVTKEDTGVILAPTHELGLTKGSPTSASPTPPEAYKKGNLQNPLGSPGNLSACPI